MFVAAASGHIPLADFLNQHTSDFLFDAVIGFLTDKTDAVIKQIRLAFGTAKMWKV